MNMVEWLKSAPKKHKALPILSFPGIQIINKTVIELVEDGSLQASCMKSIADRYDLLASVSLMDLSVEAEAFGSPVRYSDNEVPTVKQAIISNSRDLYKLTIPAVGAGRTGEYVKAVNEAAALITDIPVFAGSIGPFSLAGRLMDMTEIMMQCFEDPDLVHGTLEKVTEFLISYNKAFKKAGAGGIIMAEPAAGLLSPDLIAEFSTPYVRRIIKEVETDDFVFIYHNCGKTIPLVESILETGARAFHFGNAIELAEILPLIPGDKLVMGNVDPVGVFRNGTPGIVREETASLLNKCAKYPNFIVSSGCDIPPVAPLENIDAFFDAVKEFYELG